MNAPRVPSVLLCFKSASKRVQTITTSNTNVSFFSIFFYTIQHKINVKKSAFHLITHFHSCTWFEYPAQLFIIVPIVIANWSYHNKMVYVSFGLSPQVKILLMDAKCALVYLEIEQQACSSVWIAPFSSSNLVFSSKLNLYLIKNRFLWWKRPSNNRSRINCEHTKRGATQTAVL